MKKRKKRKMFFASPYEIDAIEKFLEKEAASGWMFIKCSSSLAGLFYVFEECEPVKLKFQIDYFDKASIFETNPESNTRDYIEYCRESGWHHVFSLGKMQIFYSVEENPVPIQTDENMRLKFASKSTILSPQIFSSLIWGLFFSLSNLRHLFNPIDYISYSTSVSNLLEVEILIFALGYFLFGIINIIRFGIFYFVNIRRLKKGWKIKYFSSKNVKIFDIIYQLFFISLLVFLTQSFQSTLTLGYFSMGLIVALTIVFGVCKIFCNKRSNRLINLALIDFFAIVVVAVIIIVGVVSSLIGSNHTKFTSGNTTYFYSTDDIDITLDDLGVDKPDNSLYEETIHNRAETFLGMREEYGDYCQWEDSSYGYSIEIFSSNYSPIMDKYNKLVFKNEGYRFTKLTAAESMWCSDQVFFGKVDNDSMYVVIGEGITYVITGNLNEAQAAKLFSYYRNKQNSGD